MNPLSSSYSRTLNKWQNKATYNVWERTKCSEAYTPNVARRRRRPLNPRPMWWLLIKIGDNNSFVCQSINHTHRPVQSLHFRQNMSGYYYEEATAHVRVHIHNSNLFCQHLLELRLQLFSLEEWGSLNWRGREIRKSNPWQERFSEMFRFYFQFLSAHCWWELWNWKEERNDIRDNEAKGRSFYCIVAWTWQATEKELVLQFRSFLLLPPFLFHLWRVVIHFPSPLQPFSLQSIVCCLSW